MEFCAHACHGADCRVAAARALGRAELRLAEEAESEVGGGVVQLEHDELVGGVVVEPRRGQVQRVLRALRLPVPAEVETVLRTPTTTFCSESANTDRSTMMVINGAMQL